MKSQVIDGYHILANLYDCKPVKVKYFTEAYQIRDIVNDLIRKSNLTLEGTFFHKFDSVNEDQSGFTGAWVLAESHITIHTWPELDRVDFDIYVCNVSRDNSESAKNIYIEFQNLYNPGKIFERIIERGYE